MRAKWTIIRDFWLFKVNQFLKFVCYSLDFVYHFSFRDTFIGGQFRTVCSAFSSAFSVVQYHSKRERVTMTVRDGNKGRDSTGAISTSLIRALFVSIKTVIVAYLSRWSYL